MGLLAPVGPKCQRDPAGQPRQELDIGRHRVEVPDDAVDLRGQVVEHGLHCVQEIADERVLAEHRRQVIEVTHCTISRRRPWTSKATNLVAANKGSSSTSSSTCSAPFTWTSST